MRYGNFAKFTTKEWRMSFTPSKETVGKNVQVEVTDKGILTITVDLKKDNGLSASGKSKIIASSEGNVVLPGTGGITVGFNCYKKV
jgi:hypothetical protein